MIVTQSITATRPLNTAELLFANTMWGPYAGSSSVDYDPVFSGGTVTQLNEAPVNPVIRALDLPVVPGCATDVEFSFSIGCSAINDSGQGIAIIDLASSAILAFDASPGGGVNFSGVLNLTASVPSGAIPSIIIYNNAAGSSIDWSNGIASVSYDDSACGPTQGSCGTTFDWRKLVGLLPCGSKSRGKAKR